MGETAANHRYALSFTSGSLLIREAIVVAPIYLKTQDWREVRRLVQEDNLLQARTQTSNERRSRETVQRLQVLTDEELALLVDATSLERAHILWVAACRRYALIGEFAQEVLREKYLLLAGRIDHADFDAFLREKAVWHEELAQLRTTTLAKLRATLFRMLIEAGFIDEEHRLLETLISGRTRDVLSSRSPSDLHFFPVRGDAL